MEKWIVYVLRSLKDRGHYIGSTDNIRRRLTEHNAGKTKSLKYRRPLKLVYQELFETIKEARARERYLKRLKGGNEFKKIIGLMPR